MNTGRLDSLAVLSVLLGLENLEENRQQSAQQERILQELNAKFDRLEKLVKEMKDNENHQVPG